MYIHARSVFLFLAQLTTSKIGNLTRLIHTLLEVLTIPTYSCRRHVGNGGDLAGKRKKRRKKRVGPVAANNPDNLENKKEVGGGVKATQGLNENCSKAKRVCSLCRV